MARHGSNEVDVIVGKNIRIRRLAKGMSQEKLGAQLGISFQQVQKYEKGVNRVGASRLSQLARILNSPVAGFFEGVGGLETADDDNGTLAVNLLAEPGAFRFAQAFSEISDVEVRRSLLDLVEQIASRMIPMKAKSRGRSRS